MRRGGLVNSLMLVGQVRACCCGSTRRPSRRPSAPCATGLGCAVGQEVARRDLRPHPDVGFLPRGPGAIGPSSLGRPGPPVRVERTSGRRSASGLFGIRAPGGSTRGRRQVSSRGGVSPRRPLTSSLCGPPFSKRPAPPGKSPSRRPRPSLRDERIASSARSGAEELLLGRAAVRHAVRQSI